MENQKYLVASNLVLAAAIIRLTMIQEGDQPIGSCWRESIEMFQWILGELKTDS